MFVCTPNALAQPWTSWKVPGTLGPADWQARIYQGIVLVTSPHSNFLFAYGSDGKLMWKRQMSWPLSQSPRLVLGQLLFQQPGQPAVLVQPETGETRQRLPADHLGWTIPREDKTWIQLGEGGQLSSANLQWTEWKSLGHLRLQRGDEWLGPPVLVGSSLYLATTRGRLQQIELGARWRSTSLGNQLPRPLLPPVPHPDGVVEIGLSGLLALRGPNIAWTRPFPGWTECFDGKGAILARPGVDADGNIYLATRRQVCSWDRFGRVRWRWRVPCASALVLGDEACYVADSSPAILKLEASSGRVLSRFPLPAGVASDPAVEKSLLAVALNNGQVVVSSALPGGGKVPAR